jgi:hypothetical protein
MKGWGGWSSVAAASASSSVRCWWRAASAPAARIVTHCSSAVRRPSSAAGYTLCSAQRREKNRSKYKYLYHDIKINNYNMAQNIVIIDFNVATLHIQF